MTATLSSAEHATENPLLRGAGLPPFDLIQADQIVPAMTQLLAELQTQLTALESTPIPTWETLVEPLQELSDRLSWSWGIVNHLMGVKNSPELRQAHEQIQPEVVKFSIRLGQSDALYRGYVALRDGADWSQMEPAQHRIITAAIRDAELSGVALAGAEKEHFNAIQLELAELSTKFSNHVLDATKAFSLTLTQPNEVDGLPASLLAQAAQAARSEGSTEATPDAGPWRISLDIPSYLPFMKHSRRSDLRETLYRAYMTRATSGDHNNQPLIERILTLRQEMAALLGYGSYAEMSLASKMAPGVEAVTGLLESLRATSYEAAVADLAALTVFAQEQDPRAAKTLNLWDVTFWAERMRETQYELNAEELRPYFPLEQVLEGLFSLATRLFGITITAADGQAPVWNSTVRYFQVADETGGAIAYFYLDPYSRPAEKRGGAWMDVCINRAVVTQNGVQTVRLPVAYLTCNQSPPVDDKPSLMTFDEVTTLFHEFGHGLQHMLTRVNHSFAAGINNVEWDAVELPSQFMENWCYDRPTLFSMAKHYETGETLPEAYYQKLLAVRNFMSGSGMLRQVHFSLTDLDLHHRYRPDGTRSANDVRLDIAKTTTVLPPLPEDRFLCAFGHIFAGGYAAGYYSYKWAEVLSADAFAAFEEAGLEDEGAIAQTGRRFRDTVLALGGSQHPMDIFKAFRGREPDTAPLLRHSGLAA